MVWLIEWEIHVGGVLHHSSPPSTKRLWHISPEAAAASPLLSVHNLMAAVTAQLIHDDSLSSIAITSFSEAVLIYTLDCSLTRHHRSLPSSAQSWETLWNGRTNLETIDGSQAESSNLVLWELLLCAQKEQDAIAFNDHKVHRHIITLVNRMSNYSVFIKTGNGWRHLQVLRCKCDCLSGRGVGWARIPEGRHADCVLPYQTAERTVIWP